MNKVPFLRKLLVVLCSFVVAAGLVTLLAPDASAKHYEIVPPESCGSCPPGPYIGPHGETCTPVGCVRPGGPCILAGDC